MESLIFALQAMRGHILRSFLTALGIAIGVAAVILLTSLGEGTRSYVMGQFTQFGTNLVAVNPGKIKTFGIPGMLGGTTHQLTIDDAEALRQIPEVRSLVPLVVGQARVENLGIGRSVFVYGVGHQAPQTWRMGLAQGSFFPNQDPRRASSITVLGTKLSKEIFPGASPLGKRVRIGGRSLTVIGVMESKGHVLGFDLDDTAYIPVATAMAIFKLDELNEIDILAVDSQSIPAVVEGIKGIISNRHRGEEDFTITTQGEMLDTFGRVLDIITISVSGIAGVSLLVGAMGILTMMWISVSERIREIGLLRALGVGPGRVARLFLLESALLSLAGCFLGLITGLGIARTAEILVPGLPLKTPPMAIPAALLMSLSVGLLSGWAPARRAARLDPVEALREE